MPPLNYDYSSYDPKEYSPDEQKLIVIWEEHIRCEFEEHNVEKTMKTMTNTPHNISVPTLAGGVGFEEVQHFYTRSFIHQMPEDIESTLVSRTIGGNRLVDESILEFTHSVVMDWILPGIAPTHRKVKIAMVAIIGFRDDNVEYEHLYWDHASVLYQVGLIEGDKLPVLGKESAEKIAKPHSIASNPLL